MLKKLIVLPTSRAKRDHIQAIKNSDGFLDKTITIGEFFTNCTSFKDNKTILSKDLRYFYLKEACKSIDLSSLGVGKNYKNFLELSAYIFEFFDDISNYKVKIPDIIANDVYLKYEDHLSILEKISKEYIKLLDQNNLCDSINKNQYIQYDDKFVSYYDEISIYYTGYFNTIEQDCLKECAKHTTINLIFNINRFNKKNIDILDSFGVNIKDIDENCEYKFVINLSTKEIITKEELKNNELKLPYLDKCQNKISQIAFVKYHITQMVKKGIDSDKIAVVLPDESFSDLLYIFNTEKYLNFAAGVGNSRLMVNDALTMLIEYLSNKNNKDITKYFNDVFLADIKKANNTPDAIIKTIDDLANILYELSKKDDKKYTPQESYAEALNTYIDELKNTIERLLNAECIIDIRDILSMLFNFTSNFRIDDTTGGKVSTIGLLESRMASFDGVIVVDFNDSLVPKESKNGKFLSSEIKTQNSLATNKDKYDLQKNYYYELFKQAKYLAICYVDDDSSDISLFYSQIFRHHETQNKNYEKFLTPNHRVNISDISKDDEISFSFDVEKFTFSPTSLKTFLDCKRRFYFKYLFNGGVREHNLDESKGPLDIGNCIHKALENAYDKKSQSIDYNKAIQEVQKEANESVDYNYKFELDEWVVRLERFKQNEIDRQKEEPFKVKACELEFDFKHNGIKFQGRIDRIDEIKGKLVLYDYKTSKGAKKPPEKQEMSDYQLLLYALGIHYNKHFTQHNDINNLAESSVYNLYTSHISTIDTKKTIEYFDDCLQEINEQSNKEITFGYCDDEYCEYCTTPINIENANKHIKQSDKQ